MNYPEAISYLLEILDKDESELRALAKRILYENELLITERTIDTVIVVTAEYYKHNLIHLN